MRGILPHIHPGMNQAYRPERIERAREILVEALKDSLGVHWVLRNKSEAGKVLALSLIHI